MVELTQRMKDQLSQQVSARELFTTVLEDTAVAGVGELFGSMGPYYGAPAPSVPASQEPQEFQNGLATQIEKVKLKALSFLHNMITTLLSSLPLSYLRHAHHGLFRVRLTERHASSTSGAVIPTSEFAKRCSCFVVAHRAHSSASAKAVGVVGPPSSDTWPRFGRGAWTACGSGISSPGERDGRLSRVDPRLLREATSHDHRRACERIFQLTGLRRGPSQAAQVPQGSGPEVLPGPCDPRAAKKNWPSTLQTKPLFSRPN